jgi:GntR family transcriptional repressor for pyruvate dehydrogenase complex
MAPPTPLKRENLPAAIAARLRRRLQRGELTPGEQLPGHRELAAAYAVSVGSIREALSMLTTEGLIETRPGRGTFVTEAARSDGPVVLRPPLSRREVEELIEARRLIETRLAELAAARATPQQIDELNAALAVMAEASASPDRYPDADVDFHLAVAAAANNRYLLEIMIHIRSLLRDDMELGVEALIRRFGDTGPSVASHGQLVERIASRDSEGARELADAIIRRNEQFVLGLYGMAEDAEAN